MKKKDYLKVPIEHIDITSFNAETIMRAMGKMSFTARELAQAAEIYNRMLADKKCAVILTIAGSTGAAGCMRLYADLIKHNMVDAVVATGAAIVDMDFFEALGFKHYQGSARVDDKTLRGLYIDRIYDTFIDEDELQACDRTIREIADALPPRPYSSREFIREMGRYLTTAPGRRIPSCRPPTNTMSPYFVPLFPTAAPVSDWSCISTHIARATFPSIR